jgi:hypothetical protein
MEWIENTFNMTSWQFIGMFVFFGLFLSMATIFYFWYIGKLEHFYARLAGILIIILALGWQSGIIQSWVSDYETFPTQNSINYETKEQYIQFWNDCVENMKRDEGKFAGAFCSGGSSGFADFNYYAKKESRKSK